MEFIGKSGMWRQNLAIPFIIMCSNMSLVGHWWHLSALFSIVSSRMFSKIMQTRSDFCCWLTLTPGIYNKQTSKKTSWQRQKAGHLTFCRWGKGQSSFSVLKTCLFAENREGRSRNKWSCETLVEMDVFTECDLTEPPYRQLMCRPQTIVSRSVN